MSTAQEMQLAQMQRYIASCQHFFEKVLTDLLLAQPADPHEFMVERLQSLPVSEREDLKQRVAAADERKNNFEDKNFDRSKNCIQIVLSLNVVEGDDSMARVESALNELRAYARTMPACLRYDICVNGGSREFVVLQQWASQNGLDAYYNSDVFIAATPKFKGLLVSPPDERVYRIMP